MVAISLAATREEARPATQRQGQRRLTIAALCAAIEQGTLPAEHDGDSYTVKRHDLTRLVLLRSLRRVGRVRFARLVDR